MKTLSVIICLLLLNIGFSQELSVVYDVKIVKAPREIKKALKKMPDSKLTMRYSGKKTYSHLNLMGLFLQTVVYNGETENGFILMEVSGVKIMVKMNKEQLEQFNNGKDTQPIVQEVKGSKKILGYNCNKAEMQVPDGNSFTAYYTDAIKNTHENFPGLKGFPLEYNSSYENMELALTASAVDQKSKIKDKIFEAPTSGYKEISFEDLMKGKKK